MQFASTNCCAIQEITDLSGHTTAQEAMSSFCTQVVRKGVRYRNSPANLDTLYSFYLFTAALGDGSRPYGNDFAELIKKEELGEIWESPSRVNLAYHKEHSNKVWIWIPDREKILSWWDQNDPSSKNAKKETLQKRLDSWKISKTSNRWYRCFSSIPVFPAGCGEALPEGIDAAMHHNEAGGISGHVYCLVCWKRISAEIKTKLEEFEVKS